jgi:8-oxo-dGTP pyrophosphatase MutT (NUDIX family)
MSSKTSVYCTNCGEHGHITKQCLQPITSYGAIVFRIRGGWNQAESLVNSDTAINGMESIPSSNIEYLLIQRRDSLGYIDILRGKYKLGDTEYIKQQVRGMTREERHKILNLPFNVLWEQLWGPITDGANPYRQEKETSSQKLEALRANDLKTIIDSCEQTWATPEWGFPKGRRDIHESEYMCALREMKEETGLTEADVIPIKNLDTIRETFFGSNRVQYCHKYFIFYVPKEKEIVFDPTNRHMSQEIGDLRWCSVEEGLQLIRPENIEKREVLLRVSGLLRKYCPFKYGDDSFVPFRRGVR